jgi:protein gp37
VTASKIEWTDETWNPVVGCSAVSPGCDNCYAARKASGRLKTSPAYAGLAENGVFNGTLRALTDRLEQPFKWRRPRRVFVNSMSDLFHPDVLKMTYNDRPLLARILAVMVANPRHTFQVLTKRPQLMAAVLRNPMLKLDVNAMLLEMVHEVMPGGMSEPETPWPRHMQFGTSVESDRYTFRANHLRETPSAIRFLSLEPLIGPLPSLDLTGIDWVIAGGESGQKARPMNPEWARDLRNRCEYHGIPFMFKQWGAWAPEAELDLQSSEDFNRFTNEPTWTRDFEGVPMVGWRGRVPFRTLDGRLWDGYPE